jgi:hypothetical protein
MEAKEIERVLTRLLEPHGAKKKGSRWLLESAETVCHLRLEADRRRRHQFHLPFWVFVRELWKGPALAEPLWEAPVWHISGSRYTPNVKESARLESCLNLTDIDHSSLAQLENLCSEMVLPLLLELRTVSGIRRANREELLRQVAVRIDLQKFLTIFPV